MAGKYKIFTYADTKKIRSICSADYFDVALRRLLSDMTVADLARYCFVRLNNESESNQRVVSWGVPIGAIWDKETQNRQFIAAVVDDLFDDPMVISTDKLSKEEIDNCNFNAEVPFTTTIGTCVIDQLEGVDPDVRLTIKNLKEFVFTRISVDAAVNAGRDMRQYDKYKVFTIEDIENVPTNLTSRGARDNTDARNLVLKNILAPYLPRYKFAVDLDNLGVTTAPLIGWLLGKFYIDGAVILFAVMEMGGRIRILQSIPIRLDTHTDDKLPVRFVLSYPSTREIVRNDPAYRLYLDMGDDADDTSTLAPQTTAMGSIFDVHRSNLIDYDPKRAAQRFQEKINQLSKDNKLYLNTSIAFGDRTITRLHLRDEKSYFYIPINGSVLAMHDRGGPNEEAQDETICALCISNRKWMNTFNAEFLEGKIVVDVEKYVRSDAAGLRRTAVTLTLKSYCRSK